MNSWKRSLGLTALVAGSLLFTACGSSTTTTDGGATNKDGLVEDVPSGTDGPVADSGDAGAGDSRVDGGRDGGRDIGPRDTGVAPCPAGTEGCPCTFDPNDMAGRSDCTEGLSCIPWDLSDNAMNPSASNATCIRGCSGNADCTGAGYGECSGIVAWQVDSMQIPFLSYCAPTRAPAGEVCRVGREGRDPVVGCAVGSSCQASFDQNMGASPLAGTCTTTCTWTQAAPQGDRCAAGQVCNPFLASSTSTQAFGFCDTQVRDVGSICTDTAANRSCAFAAATFCLQFQGDDTGTCVEVCRPDMAIGTQCNVTRASPRDTTANLTCETAIAMGTNGPVGLCDNNCSQFPNSCPGNTTCNGQGATFGMNNPPVNWTTCLDLEGPFLTAAAPTITNGMLTPPTGADNCAAATEMRQCPSGSACFTFDQGGTMGACLTLCGTSTDAAFRMRYPRGGCETYTATTVVCEPVMVMGFPANGGICAF